ncbi:hypothetical protein [Nocardioides sp. SYSU DS0651]|uniref:hypothetical protein n=1 Tax=Nocardioides sp. SYSU DS0651 TaxID=3415955 RepID=UPI003F4BDDBB
MTICTAVAAPASVPSSTDHVDQVVHHLIERYFAGDIDDRTARREICGALFTAGIHRDVATRRTDLSHQTRADLADLLLHLLVEKLTDRSFFSLATARGRSACGWARQVARTALPSELRNHRRAGARNGAPVDPTSHAFAAMVDAVAAPMAGTAGTAGTASTASTVAGRCADPHASHLDDLADDYVRRTRGMRERDRLVVSAQALCAGLGVPGAVRPEAMADRDRCVAALEADDTLAYRSLRMWRAVVVDGAAVARSATDDLLLALWDDQTEDSSAALLARPAEVSHLLALAAASPLPRPPRKALQRLRTAVAGAAGPRDEAWREIAGDLVDSYIAAEHEACSDYATLSDEVREAARAAHRGARDRLDAVLARAAAHPAAPYGDTPRLVLAAIRQAAGSVLDAARPVARLRPDQLTRAA